MLWLSVHSLSTFLSLIYNRLVFFFGNFQEFESSLSPIKSKIAEVQSQGKQLKDSCSSQDGPFIKEQLEKLNGSWSQLYSDSLGRKHQLEDALLQLGQFHDALAELLEWIANCKSRLTNARPPAVKIRGIEAQANDLEVSVHVCVLVCECIAIAVCVDGNKMEKVKKGLCVV